MVHLSGEFTRFAVAKIRTSSPHSQRRGYIHAGCCKFVLLILKRKPPVFASNGTPPGLSGVGLNGDNPSTGSIIGTSPPRDESFNPPTSDLQSVPATSSLTPTASTVSSPTSTASSATTTTPSTTTSRSTTSTQTSASSESNSQIGSKSSLGPGDALFATSMASTTASTTAPRNPALTGSSTGPASGAFTLSSTTTNTKVVPLPLTATVSDWLTTSSPSAIASSNPTGSPKHTSLAPGIIVGAVLAGTVAMLCLFAAIICCRRLRERRGRPNSDESSEGRPTLPALGTFCFDF